MEEDDSDVCDHHDDQPFCKIEKQKNEIMKMKKKKKDEINKEHFCCFASEDSNNICETRYVFARDVFFSICIYILFFERIINNISFIIVKIIITDPKA